MRAKTRWDSDQVLDGLTNTIARIVGKGVNPDVVAITGDAAFSGRREEYEEARRWIDKGLLAALPSRFPRRNILVVPGNHDVDRSTVNAMCRATQSELLKQADQDGIAEVLHDEEQRRMVLRRHDAYLEFANGLRSAKDQLDVPWWSTTLKLQDRQVHFAGLCSSWMSCSDNDRNDLLVSRWQIHQVLKGAAEADCSVALVHHPWDYLAEFDADKVEESVHHACDLVLRGHRHRQQARSIHYAGGSRRVCLELAAGSAFAGSDYANAFQLIELHPDEQRTVRVHFWVWNELEWIADRNACPEAPDGVATFVLKPPKASPALSRKPPRVDPAKYLRSLREQTGYINVRGLQVGSGKAQRFPIDELFIPLTTTVADLGGPTRAKDKRPPGGLAGHGSQRVELQHALRNPRLAIVADPGAGKTTFLHRVASSLCRSRLGEDPQAAQKDLGLADAPFPIFIRLTDLTEHITTARKRDRGPMHPEAPAWLAHFAATESRECERRSESAAPGGRKV